MTSTSGTGQSGTQDNNYAGLLGLEGDKIVQEIGWDEDCDSEISESIENAIGADLLDVDTDEVVDAVLLWFREEDGDLVDGLVDSIHNLADDGQIWLLSPAAGSTGHIEPGVVSESAQLAGLVQTSAERLGNWQAACLVPRGTKR